LLWGAYHFGTAAPVDAQVANFVSAAQPDAQTLVALDYESNGADTMTLEQARGFLIGVADRLGRRPVLYSGGLIKQELGDVRDPFFAAHRLWLPEYGPEPHPQASWQTAWLWQYAGDGIGCDPKTVAG